MQKRNDFLYANTYVLEDVGATLVTIPKAACTSIKHLLADRYHIPRGPLNGETHPSMWVHARESFSCLPSVPSDGSSTHPYTVYVRNPFARLVSAWADKVLLQDTGYESPLDISTFTSEYDLVDAFYAFVLGEHLPTVTSSVPLCLDSLIEDNDPHFLPQTTLIGWLPAGPSSTVVQLEDDHLRTVHTLLGVAHYETIKINVGLPLNAGAFFSNPAVRSKTLQLYAADLDLGYSFPKASPQVFTRPFLPWAISCIREKNLLLAANNSH